MTTFNPPPGWPVEPGFVPAPDWSPDPSWPAAPAGWQFWLDDPEAVPVETDDEPWAQQVAVPVIAQGQNPTGTSDPAVLGYAPRAAMPRRTVLIAGALALALVAAVTTVVVWKHYAKEPAGRPDNMLAATFPTKPEAAWRLNPSSLLDGHGDRFSTPVFTAADYGAEGAIVAGDRAFVHVRPHDGDDGQLVAISLSDGHIEWSIPSPANEGCARNLVGTQLACQKRGASGSYSSLQFIDADTGKVASTVEHQASMLASDGTSLYTAGYSQGDDGLFVTKGTPKDPVADWKTIVHSDRCAGYGSGDALDLTVRHGVIYGYDGGAEIALRTADGSPLFDHEVMNVRLHEPDTVVANRCMPDQSPDKWPTEVVDLDGKQRFTTPLRIESETLQVHRGGPPPMTTLDGDALDPMTGENLWHIPNGVDWQVGNVGLARGNQALTAYDMTSGKQLWHSGLSADSVGGITDGKSVIAAIQESGFVAVSLTDGSQLWAVPGTEEGAPVLYATDAGILAVGRSGIAFYRPTGPAADVPEFGAPAAEKSSGGTKLVTKCGRPPHFEPQAIRTESGALAITMKIVAQCPGGDVLSSGQTRLAVSSAGQNVASGTFDLSSRPIVIAPNSTGSNDNPTVTHDFTFPVGTFWRIPVSLNDVPSAASPQTGPTDLDATTLVVDCQQDGRTGASQSNSDAANDQASMATGPAAPATGDPESASFDALRALATADRPFVSANLADRWVPQLSSKRPGLVADGITWDNAATLREHLDLRLKYPEVRLLYSGDWSTFSAPDFWVTIAGVTFPDAGGALGWCRDHGFDRDHCYAKLVSTSHPIDGSTAFNP